MIDEPSKIKPVIRKFHERDLDRIKRLERSAFLDYPWQPEDFIIFLRNIDKGNEGFVAEFNDSVIGFMFIIKSEWYYEIITVAVSYEFRGIGVASQFIDYLKGKLIPYSREDIYARVRTSNKKAITFFEKNGFVIIGQKDKCYEDNNEGCVKMKYEMVELPLKSEYQHL